MGNSEIIEISKEFDVARAVLETVKLAKELGFRTSEQNRIATAVSELGKNIIRYAKKGKLTLCPIQNEKNIGIEVIAEDQGPGIKDIDKAMTEHFTTTQGSLGLGLKAVKRIMDEFQIESQEGLGTRVTARRWVIHGEN